MRVTITGRNTFSTHYHSYDPTPGFRISESFDFHTTVEDLKNNEKLVFINDKLNKVNL